MRCALATLAALAAAGLVVAGLVVGVGLYNVSAAAGHLPGVSWVLHTTYRHSVGLRAPSADAVPLLTDDMAAVAARHFDTACRVCHAAPGERRSATVRSLVPEPPPIERAVEGWQPRHLFWIVLNGVKMSGMPHWPAENRRDEAWMMAAFLDRVRDMTPAAYAALTETPRADDPLVAYCAGCHGRDGAGRGNAAMPRIDILGAPYIAASLTAFRERLRESGIMQQAASQLSDEQIDRLARHFGRGETPLTVAAPGPPAGPAAQPAAPGDLVAAGRRLAFGHPDSRGTPACRACHGPWPERRDPLFPMLAGQRAGYLRTQLGLWREGHRGGTARATLMHSVAGQLEDDQIDALAAFYAAGGPAE